MSYVVVKHDESDDTIFCLGVFEKYNAALGEVMNNIFIIHRDFHLEGDEFEWNEPDELEGNRGIYITLNYKASYQSNVKTINYYILDPLNEEKKPV